MAANYSFEIQKIYVAYFNRPADFLGLTFWNTAIENAVTAAGPNTVAQAAAVTATLNSISSGFSTSAEYIAEYGSLGTSQVVTRVYQNLFGHAPDPAGLVFWSNAVNAGHVTLATAVTQIAEGAQGSDLVTFNNRVSAAVAFSNELDTGPEVLGYNGTVVLTAAKSFLASISDDASLAAALTGLVATVANVLQGRSTPITVNLTTATDNFTGTAGSENYVASALTITSLDKIDAGAGTDTLTVTDAAGGSVNLGLISVSNVESLTVSSAAGVGAAGTADVSGYVGLTSAAFTLKATAPQSFTVADTTDITVTNGGNAAIVVNGGGKVAVSNAGGPVTITGKAGLTSASVSGGANVLISDAAKATLTSVTLAELSGAATINANALTSLSVATSGQNITVNAGAQARVLALNINNLTDTTISDLSATTIAINASGSQSTGLTLLTDAASALTIAGDRDLSLTLSDAGLSAGQVGSIVSTSTAAVSILNALNVDTAYTGGAGADTITVGATNAAVNTGNGADVVTLTASPSGTGTINGGGGTDVLAVSAANAALASLFAGKISGFERLILDALAASSTTVNLANLGDISHVSASSDISVPGAAFTLTNMISGGTLQIGAGATYTIGIKDAASGSADVVNLLLSSAAALNAGSVSAANVETINITTLDTAIASGSNHIDTLALIASSAQSIVVSGNAGLNLINTGNTNITSFDASAISVSTAPLAGAANASVTFTSANTSALASVTIKGGAGNDTLTGNIGSDIITGGAGDDIIDGKAGTDILSGGAGKDTFIFFDLATSSVSFDTITDFAAGESIHLCFDILNADANPLVSGTQLGAQLTGLNGAVLQNYLNAAAGQGLGIVSWFQLGGNTYVVQDINPASSFINGSDTVVMLTGLIDLSGATLTSVGSAAFGGIITGV